jgi:hypothetical protein
VTTHKASCRCGQLSATITGDPVRVSVCHCLDCKRRSGSSFAAQARFPAETVQISGESQAFAHRNDEGKVTRFHFCPACGGNVYYIHDFAPETVAILLGTLDDPYAFRPTVSVFENRKHDWLAITGDDIEHD